LNKTANTYNKELQPSKKDLVSQIQKSKAGEAFKTIGAKIRDEVDDAGKPLYVGTYQTMNDKAKNTISSKGQELLNVLKKYDKTVKINKNEIAGNIIDQLSDSMGTLKPSEIKIVQNELKRIAEKEVTPTQALKYKRRIDWKTNHQASYIVARKNKWLEKCCLHMENKITKWTFEKCLDIALSFKKRGHWNIKHPNSAQAAIRNGWYEKICTYLPLAKETHVLNIQKKTIHKLKELKAKANICRAIKYNQTAGGYHWAYCDENGNVLPTKGNNK
jgi:hypothetical protein